MYIITNLVKLFKYALVRQVRGNLPWFTNNNYNRPGARDVEPTDRGDTLESLVP